MKVFFQFAPKFVEWPLAMIDELSRRHPDFSAMGFATGPSWVLERIKESRTAHIAPVDMLNELEGEWLNNDLGSGRLVRYERQLGTDAINQIIIADRHLGHGHITGGVQPRSKLIEATSNPDRLRSYLVAMLDHLHDRLSLHKPDVVFCYAVAGAPAVALYHICRLQGIPFRRLAYTRIGQRYLLEPEIVNVLTSVEESLLKCAPPILDQDDWNQARRYLEEFRSRPRQPDYSTKIMARKRKDHRLTRLLVDGFREPARSLKGSLAGRERTLRKPLEWERLRTHFRTNWLARREMSGDRFVRLDDLDLGPYVYYPLHHDPEASTMVMAPDFTDQMAVVEAIAKAMPLSMDLVVKEHVPMIGRRPPGFYDRIQALPRTHLIGPFEDQYECIKRADLVCTITGTAATEALLLGRRALVFAEAPFSSVGKGFVQCRSLQELSRDLPRALEVPIPNDAELERYLATVFVSSFEFPSEFLWGNVDRSFVRDRLEVVKVLCDALQTGIHSRQEMQGDEPDALIQKTT